MVIWKCFFIFPEDYKKPVFVKRKMGHKASEKWANWGKKKSGLSEKPVFFN